MTVRNSCADRAKRRSAFAGAAAVILCLCLAGAAAAQTMTNSFGGFSKSSGEPIDIESDVLVVHDSKKYATFKGNVKAVQGTTTLRAQELDVHYTGGGGDSLTAATPVANTAGAKPADPATQISKIEAKGNVVITSDQDQTTTSDWALYDVPAQTVTVGGNVVLMQDKNMLKGDRLVIDLKTGESRFENTDKTVAGGGGRIRALFVPKQDDKPGAAKDGGKPSDPDKAAKAKAEASEDAATKAAKEAAKEAEKQNEDLNKILSNEFEIR
jgi:lipopolysaccharide export system protein LptA